MVATQGERLASLEQRVADHEARCEERLAEIRTAGAATLSAVEGLKGRAWAVIFALLAWALAQLWSANRIHPNIVERPAYAQAPEMIHAAAG